MNVDGVAAAFEVIIEEIENIAGEIATQGASAFRDKAYDIAQKLSEDGKTLQEFRSKIETMLEDWQKAVDVPTRQRFNTSRLQDFFLEPKATTPGSSLGAKHTRTHTKSPKTRIRVTFEDGTEIEEYYAADTFALALRHFGLDRVVSLRIMERNLALVGDIKSDQYGQRRVDGKYICTHSSSLEKKATLESIGKRLGISVKVVVLEVPR